jgi:prophage regulatory protein
MQIPFSEMPDEAFVRLSQVKAIVGLSRSTIYENVEAGRFPKQHKLTRHAAGWRLGDIRAWLRNPADWKPSTSQAEG